MQLNQLINNPWILSYLAIQWNLQFDNSTVLGDECHNGATAISFLDNTSLPYVFLRNRPLIVPNAY
jgi:hypothetical protein